VTLLPPSGSTTAWRRIRLVILERDGWACQLRLRCDGARATHVDHRVSRSQWPVGQPGVDAPANLQASCAACNLAKGRGATLRSWAW
jgi:5-methylcytosine-specific restriction endonuclease McrA